MHRPLNGVGFYDRAARLVGKQVDGVRRVMPQKMVGPGARLPKGVHIAAPKEKRLHIEVLNVKLISFNFAVYPLVRRIETARMAAHCHQARLLLQCHHRPSVGQRVGQWNFDLYMLACLHARDRLCGVHLRRRA